MEVRSGRALQPGVALGPVYVQLPRRTGEEPSAFQGEGEELARFVGARQRTLLQLDQLYRRTREQVGEEQAEVFHLHRLMLEDGDYLATVEPKVKAALGKNFSVYRSEPYFLEILPRGIDKAQSLERLLEVLGLTREAMIACGDGYNDLSMIQYAGLGVAMENAVLPVRQAGDFVTKSNNDDGIAHVIEKFIFS